MQIDSQETLSFRREARRFLAKAGDEPERSPSASE